MKTYKNKKNKKQDKLEELHQILLKQLAGDMVRAGYYYLDIERRNEAFARGWRWGIKSTIRLIEDMGL